MVKNISLFCLKCGEDSQVFFAELLNKQPMKRMEEKKDNFTRCKNL